MPKNVGLSAIKLESEREVDYTKLQGLLQARNFIGADKETSRLLSLLGNNHLRDVLNISVKTLPCQDLQTIDSLWVKATNGCSGLSIQNRIWQEQWQNYYSFKERVKWGVFTTSLSPNNVISEPYSGSNPETVRGFLPSGKVWCCTLSKLSMERFFSHLDSCGIR